MVERHSATVVKDDLSLYRQCRHGYHPTKEANRSFLKRAEGVHTLTIVNTDGRSADVAFPVSPLTITEVNATTDGSSVALAVKGSNFVGRRWAAQS